MLYTSICVKSKRSEQSKLACFSSEAQESAKLTPSGATPL